MNARHPSSGGRPTGAALTVSAFIVVAAVTLAPGVIASGSALALVRVPVEALVAVGLLTATPWPGVRGVLAAVLTVFFIALVLLAGANAAFEAVLARPFNSLADWQSVADGYGVLADSIGAVAAAALATLACAVTVGLGVALGFSLLRVGRVLRARPPIARAGGVGLAAGWLAAVLVGAHLVPGEPIAAADGVRAIQTQARQASATLRERAALREALASDPYRGTLAADLLSGLRGKDVIIAFIESYGQVAVQGSSFSPGVADVLRAGDAQLQRDGYSARSAFLTSSTFGGVSWLAHATLQTGLWIDDQQSYDEVTATDRLTLAGAFKKAGWRTVSDVPSNTGPWPAGTSFYHYDRLLDARNVGYRGPRFSYARIPDQYTWDYFQKHELEGPHQPVMAEIDFVSSHTPWTPLPSLVPWASIGDGSVFASQPARGQSPSQAWRSTDRVRQLYGESIQYSLGALFSFLHQSKNPNLVLVVLGDHQPGNTVSGDHPNHNVPISIIAKDPEVLSRISSWHFSAGMLPAPDAPVWRMDAFRDRFLDAYGPD